MRALILEFALGLSMPLTGGLIPSGLKMYRKRSAKRRSRSAFPGFTEH